MRIKRIFITVIVLLLAWSGSLQAQRYNYVLSAEAPTTISLADSAFFAHQGDSYIKAGKNLAVSGGLNVLAGVGIMALGVVASNRFLSSTEDRNIGTALSVFMLMGSSIILGMVPIYVGCAEAMCGVPFLVAGRKMNSLNCNWEEVDYSGVNQKGLGFIIEGGCFAGIPSSGIEARLICGYNFNENVFLGAGVAPTLKLEISEDGKPITPLPVFADLHVSFRDRLVSPYVSLGAGMDFFTSLPYYNAQFGGRVRLSQTRPNSVWTSLFFETDTNSGQIGINLGYSF